MRVFAQLFVAATAILGAVAQYDDGYENVTTSTTPVQIRLAYQGPTAMMVSWNTFAQLSSPTVSYGIDPSALIQTASSSVSVTYATSLTYNNHVNITGLLPYTTYYYLPQYSNATTPYTFTTARLAGDPTPYTVGVVIDMGTFGALGLSDVVGTGASNPLRTNEQTTISALEEMIDNYEFMVHAGDIAYADYWLKEEIGGYLPNTTTQEGAMVYESILNAFFDEMLNITSEKAYMVNAGNHEANCDNGGTTNKATGQKYTESICLAGQTNFTGYINHWRMPSGPSGGLGNFWYSYDYGMTHFIHIDTETDLGNGLVGPDEGSPEYGGPFGSYNQQINWLTNDLASVNRTLTPWIVVFGHRGWYLSASSSVCANCQTAFENIFYQYGVDLYMNGHAHLYERTAPIYDGTIDPNGLNNPSATLYITNGAAGHYDGLDSFTAIQPYSVYREDSDYAWSTIAFTNSTHMTIDTLWSANNTVFDSATLYKAHTNTTVSSSTTSSSLVSSTSSSVSSVSMNPTQTTSSATTTTASVYPSYTNFMGQGHLYVYSGGVIMGDIGSAGTWYNAAGQNTATYTAVPLYSNGTAFTLQHSTSYCAIGSDSSFACAAASSGATIFGQTADGNLTYNSSPAFYASSAASSSSRPTVYATPLAVSLNIVWGGTATSSVSSATSTSSSSSIATPVSTTSSSVSSTSTSQTQTSVSTSLSASSSTASLTSVSGSSSSPSSISSTPTSSQSPTFSPTSSPSASSSSASLLSSSSASISSVSSFPETSTSSPSASSSSSSSSTQSSSSSSSSSNSLSLSSTSSSGSSSLSVPTSSSTTSSSSVSSTSSSTFVSTSSLSASSNGGTVTATQVSASTETDTVTQTETEIDSTTVTQQGSTVTQTQPASTVTQSEQDSTITQTQAASTVFVTEQDSTVTQTQPGSTTTQTQAASTVFVTQQGSTATQTQTQSASTVYVTQPGSTVTFTQSASTVYVTQPASTVTQSQSATTVTQTGSQVCTSQPISTVYSTVTYTTTQASTYISKSTITSDFTTTQSAYKTTVTSDITITKPGTTVTSKTTLTTTKPASTITSKTTVTVTTTRRY